MKITTSLTLGRSYEDPLDYKLVEVIGQRARVGTHSGLVDLHGSLGIIPGVLQLVSPPVHLGQPA